MFDTQLWENNYEWGFDRDLFQRDLIFLNNKNALHLFEWIFYKAQAEYHYTRAKLFPHVKY